MCIQQADVQREADAIRGSLAATDPRFSHVVRMRLRDRTTLEFSRAFAEMWEYHDNKKYDDEYDNSEESHIGSWIVVFTEHHGYHVYAEDDVSSYEMFQRVRLPIKQQRV